MAGSLKDVFDEIDRLQEKIDRHRPLDEHMRKQIKEYFRIGLTFSSNAIEGNSLTETETKIVLEDGITIGGKPLRDHFEAVGHSQAFDHIYTLADLKTITEEDIKQLHRLFYLRIDPDNAGSYRKVDVIITGSKYNPPLPKELSKKMKRFITDMEAYRKKLHPVEAAALAHKDFVFIHPFVDGNGRVARLLMNLILLQEGHVITLIPPTLRVDYVRALEKAHTDDRDFVRLIAEMVIETQQDYMRLLRINFKRS